MIHKSCAKEVDKEFVWLKTRINEAVVHSWIPPDFSGEEKRHIEFKDAPPDDKEKILNTLTALANVGGGCIIFGIRNSGFLEHPPESLFTRNERDLDRYKQYFEGVMSDAKQHIRPSISEYLERFPLEIKPNWRVIVLQIIQPSTNQIFTYKHIAFTRDNQPASIKMDPGQIWRFHEVRLYPSMREQLLERLREYLPFVLAEIAFQIMDRSSNTIEDADINIIIRKISDKDFPDLCEAVRTHEAIEWNNPGWRFTSYIKRDYYTAHYLHQLQIKKAPLVHYLLRSGWEDIVLNLAHLADDEQIVEIVNILLAHDRLSLAIRAFIKRNRQIIVSASLRNYIINFLEQTLKKAKDDFERVAIMDITMHLIKFDLDALIRRRALTTLSRTTIPVSIALRLIDFLNADWEVDDDIRLAAASVFVDSKITGKPLEEVALGLLETLSLQDSSMIVFETIFVATISILWKTQQTLTIDQKDLIYSSTRQITDYYQLNSPWETEPQEEEIDGTIPNPSEPAYSQNMKLAIQHANLLLDKK